MSLGTQSKAVEAFSKRNLQPKSRQRTALDSLSSALRKGVLADGSELSSEDDVFKLNPQHVETSEDEKTDDSIKLPTRTGDFDKDISPTPKVPKSLYGLKVKRSKSASTSKAKVTASNSKGKLKVDIKDGNDTDSSDVLVPCSGTVSGMDNIT